MLSKMNFRLRSVGLKLFGIIFFSIIVCVITVGLFSYNKAKEIIEQKVSDATLQTINQLNTNLTDYMATYTDLSMQILIDKDFHTYSTNIISSTDDYKKYESQRAISDMIQNFMMGNDNISGIMLLPVVDGLPTIVAGSASISRAEEAVSSAWYQKTIELGGKVNWIDAQNKGIISGIETPSFALSRLIKNMTTGSETFVIVIEVKLDALKARYSTVDLGEGSSVAIINGAGNYITSEDRALIGAPANISLPKDSYNSRSTLPDGQEVLVAYSNFSDVDWSLVGTIPVEQLVKDAKGIAKLTYIMAGLAVLLAIAIGIFVMYSIGNPLTKLQQLMKQGAQGNLTVRSNIKASRKDEIGELSVSFNEMIEQIGSLAVRTTQSATEVLTTAAELTDSSRKTAISAKEISVATEEIANGASSLAVEAEKGSDLSHSINAQMNKVMEANQEMINSAVEVQQASGEGTMHMNTLMNKTGQTEEMTRAMVEKVDSLKESTGSIVKILDVLNNITKQTNILSLNATIEAARAGAAGKGFMVVADEIRKLAEQSHKSIEIVGQIIGKIQEEIEETVSVLSNAYPLFQEQIGSVKDANQIFLTVQAQMEQFAKSLDLVTISIGELDKSQSILSEAMTNVSAVAEQSSATSEEVASLSSEQLGISDNLVRLSERLDAVSQELKSSLSRFQI